MRPVPSPLPLLRVITAVMAVLALLFAAHLMWQRHISALPIEDRFSDTAFQDQLIGGLLLLSASVQPGAAIDPPATCPHSADQEATRLQLAQLQCARASLNAKLAAASKPRHVPAWVIEDSLQADLLKSSMQWLTRNARDGNHALELLRNPEQTARQNSMPDPFRLLGCLFASVDTVASADDGKPCDGRAVVAVADLPPHAQGLLYPVSRYRAATRGESPNILQWEAAPGAKTPLAQGRHITAAWNAQFQAQAQTMADCYVGNVKACQECPWCNTARANTLFESARARAMGILIVDVKTGAIDAAASAYTPCYAAQQRGEQTPAGCPDLPATPEGKRPERSFRLGSQALTQTAKPGSQVKIPIALSLMQAGLSPRETVVLSGILTRSATEELIDIVLCKEQGFLPSCALRRLLSVQTVTRDMGWQEQTDILALEQVEGLSSHLFAARLLQLPLHNGVERAIPLLDQNAMRECGLKPVAQRWRNCHGADLNNILAELFGQGNALSSPVGIANGLLQLAAAGNGQTSSSSAHLLAAVQDSKGVTRPIGLGRALAFKPGSAAPVLLGLSRTHTEGTAHSACLAASKGVAWAIPCSAQAARDGETVNLRIASKTGTPGFDADRFTLPQWRAYCARASNELAITRKAQARWYHLHNELAKCQMAPTKWFSMLVGKPDTNTWDKVVVVVAERNWYRTTERVDSAFDKVDANVAAEVGLSLANSLYANDKKSSRTLAFNHNPQKGQQ